MPVPQNGDLSSGAGTSPGSRSRAQGDEHTGSSERHPHHGRPVMRRRRDAETDLSNLNNFGVQPRQLPSGGPHASSMNLPTSTGVRDLARGENGAQISANRVNTSEGVSGARIQTRLVGGRYSAVFPEGPDDTNGVVPGDRAIPISRTPSFDDQGAPPVPPSPRHHYRRSRPNDRRSSGVESNSPTSDDVGEMSRNFAGFTVHELAAAVDGPQRRRSGITVTTRTVGSGLSSSSDAEESEGDNDDDEGDGDGRVSSGSEENLSGDSNVPNSGRRRSGPRGPRLTNGDP